MPLVRHQLPLPFPGLLLAVVLLLVSPRSGRGEDAIAYKFQSWQEDAGRIRVDAHYGLVEKDFSPSARLRVTGVIDTIVGATPTGAPPEEGSDDVPLAQLRDRRKAWQVDYSQQLARINVTGAYANSRESDYVSHSYSLNTLTDFNEKNTTVLVGAARADDDVTARFLPAPRSKRTEEAIIGVTQLFNPRTSLTVNFTFSRARGYLSDPYKIVGQTVELLPGLPLALTFPENRPEKKDKRILYAGLNRRIERLDAAVEASWRYLHDSFGTTSHTLALEWYQRIGARLVVRPGVRWYRQSAADFYFVTLDGTGITPAAQPTGQAPYYSADYRLAEMDTWTFGIKAAWEMKPWLTVDATVERYLMRGRDGVTPASAFADADIFTIGLKLWR